MLKSLALILTWSFPIAALAQEQIPKGPPWTDMCSEIGGDGFSKIFESQKCQDEFLAVYRRFDREKDIHEWMLTHRSCLHEWAHFSWLAVFLNEEKMARLAWYHQLYLAKTRFLSEQPCEGESCNFNAVEAALRSNLAVEIDQSSIEQTTQFLDKIKKNTGFKVRMDKAYAAVDAMCLSYGNFECRPAMKLALDWMYPHSFRLESTPKEYMTISMVDFYREVFTDTKTQTYASRFALELMNSIGNNRVRLADSFYQLGLKNFEGDADRFWRFIVVYATRGSAWATGYAMVGEKNQSIFIAMMVISSAMSVLDYHYGVRGEAWSYGNIASNSCYQPKPYHYWMAAGFAHFLQKAGYSEMTAKLVARLLGAIYEVGSDTVGRNPDEVYFVPTFHSSVNRVRREITHHFLGAEFGSSADASTFISFDHYLGLYLQASRALPDITDAEMAERIKAPGTRWRYWTALTGFNR